MPAKTEKRRAEAREVAAFVNELYEESGFASWGEFAREAGVSAATISDYKRGENAPSGYRLLRLIQAARTNGTQLAILPGPDEPLSEDDLLEQASALLGRVRRLRNQAAEAR